MRIQQQIWTVADGWKGNLTSESGDRVQLLLVFGSPMVLTQPSWREDLRQCYPNAQLLGCSTAGEITGIQVLDDSLVVTAIEFEQTQVKGAAIQLLPGESSFDAGQRLGQSIEPEQLAHVFVLSDGLQVNGSDLVRGLTSQLPEGVMLTGGLSGDGDRFTETLVMLDDAPQSGMIAAVGLYGENLQIGYGSLGGWTPFGTERRITKSVGNVLYELDGKPALELYKTYLGDHAKNLPAAGLLFPLSLEMPSDQPRLVRTLLSVNEAEQSLTFAGDMPEGGTAQLMHASFDRLVDGAIEAAETCRDGLPDVEADLAILISCVGRKLLMKQRIEEEVEGVQEVLGEQAVLTGFYSYGEISPFTAGASCELHNQTMTITTFTER
ncbi:FIST C-terminal domain-containing protein [filamentous cyanobacterium LEGE 11480]|uniref:FIST C-terminal domain-containing protein n=1 Tax=Romeriopsis navalis LEGE 11480 TaxID=2777977 RepID=A0A928Z1S1_9CYAN|nr:FIST N-terminal domain-containing protein [Romeriopsis navalis]MBE9028307.1 FIST C-terminal domain-containing protein [Romeriopsis navalis LEGE 11480]